MLKDDPDALKSINDIIRDIDSNTRQNIWDEFETEVFKSSLTYKRLLNEAGFKVTFLSESSNKY